MEIVAIYLVLGLFLISVIYAIADFRPGYIFSILYVAWLPLICVGMIITLFMDLEEVSNKLNIQKHKTKK